MILKSLSLQNYRNYNKADFRFDDHMTVIIGPNAAGKTNLIEAVFLLTTGKSFRTDKEKQLVELGKAVSRVKGSASTSNVAGANAVVINSKDATSNVAVGDEIYDDNVELEVVISQNPQQILQKKYLVNGVSKRRVDFAGNLTAVLFTPLDLDIALGQPASRRKFLDEVLEQVDYTYRLALTTYSKALRQRNALLEHVQETGVRNPKLFAYWDELLIKNGQIITQKREELITYINARKKDLYPFILSYDKSVISEERLLQYKDAEVGAGVTLVGPHRDDVIIQAFHELSKETEDVKYFSSRGQQRLVVLELKLSQIYFISERTQNRPLLLLDDIFSELDESHIKLVMERVSGQQVILTTTHKEFVSTLSKVNVNMIELRQ